MDDGIVREDWGNGGDIPEHFASTPMEGTLDAQNTDEPSAADGDAEQSADGDDSASDLSDKPELDAIQAQECTAQLREQWGENFDTTLVAVRGLVNDAPPFIRQAILNGRLADGRAIGSDPIFLGWLASLTAGGGAQTRDAQGKFASGKDGINAEIASIEKSMRQDRNAYNKNSSLQARLRFLYSAREGA